MSFKKYQKAPQGFPSIFQSPFESLSSTGDSSWILSLSDLMSLLLVFFLVWTTIKVTQLKKDVGLKNNRPAVAPMHLKNLSEIRGMLFDFSPREVEGGRVMIVLDSELTFDSGSDQLSQDGKRMLARIATVLKGSTHYRLRVCGHCDKVPLRSGSRFHSNIELSIARAAAVASELAGQGMDPERIWVQGLGNIYPKVNGKGQGSRFNRRVELILEPEV